MLKNTIKILNIKSIKKHNQDTKIQKHNNSKGEHPQLINETQLAINSQLNAHTQSTTYELLHKKDKYTKHNL